MDAAYKAELGKIQIHNIWGIPPYHYIVAGSYEPATFKNGVSISNQSETSLEIPKNSTRVTSFRLIIIWGD